VTAEAPAVGESPAEPPPARPRHRRARVALIAAVAWTVFVLLHRLLSGRWWLWLLPDLLPPLAFVAVPMALLALAWFARSRWSVVVTLVSLLLGFGLSGINPHALVPGPGPVPPGALRIVSWNTNYWNFGNDHRRFYDFLTARHADVYLFQEYQPDSDRARRDADLAELRRRFPGYQMRFVGELVTISRFPIVSVKYLPSVPPDGSEQVAPPSPWPDFNRDYWSVKGMRTDLRIGARTLSVYNMHVPVPFDVISPLTARFYKHRRWYLDRRTVPYRALNADLAANRLPSLVAGDFNTSPEMGEPGFHRLSGRLREVTYASRSLYPGTWPDGFGTPWRLDHTFASPDLRVYDYRVLGTGGLSDHKLQWMRAVIGGGR
jgi:endonuclease/exonuclease/phosphatase family metal-dependent hydrolase